MRKKIVKKPYFVICIVIIVVTASIFMFAQTIAHTEENPTLNDCVGKSDMIDCYKVIVKDKEEPYYYVQLSKEDYAAYENHKSGNIIIRGSGYKKVVAISDVEDIDVIIPFY